MNTAKTATRKASTKTVKVISRIEFKNDARKVVYTVRSSNGNDQYQTTLFAGKATGCTCPAQKPCYHMTQLETKEAERNAPVAKTQPRQDEYSDEERAEVNRFGGYQPLSREEYCSVFGIYA